MTLAIERPRARRKLAAVPDESTAQPLDLSTAKGRTKALDKLRDEFLLCRDIGHYWRPHTVRWFPKAGVYHQELKCSRCETIRVRELNARGQILSSHYHYQEGYQLPPGIGFLSSGDRDGIRVRSVRRMLSEGTDNA